MYLRSFCWQGAWGCMRFWGCCSLRGVPLLGLHGTVIRGWGESSTINASGGRIFISDSWRGVVGLPGLCLSCWAYPLGLGLCLLMGSLCMQEKMVPPLRLVWV